MILRLLFLLYAVDAVTWIEPRHNQTYTRDNLTLAFNATESDNSTLTFEWSPGIRFSLTIVPPSSNQTYNYSLDPTDLGWIANVTFLHSNNYTFLLANATFQVVTECSSTTLNLTDECRTCWSGFENYQEPPCTICQDAFELDP
jgi:hypothetical protein